MNYTEHQLTSAVVSQGLRPVLACPESSVPASLLCLIQKCWDTDPNIRPSFRDVVSELDAMLGSVEKENDKEDAVVGSVTSHGHVDTTNTWNYHEPVNWFSRGQKFLEAPNHFSETLESTWFGSMYSDYQPDLSWGSFSTGGRRESMEDTHFMIPNFYNRKDTQLFGIFDGHRGAEAAEFSAGALPGILQTLISTSSPSQALQEAFLKTDIAFREELNLHRKSKRGLQKDWHPGCTAVAALIIRNKLFVANAGDCRTIICRAGNPYALTRDHVASSYEERERVIRAGGEIKLQVDTWRVGPAALQVTRSIGDDDLKPYVTAKPEITETSLSSEDEYIVMASDGLWDVVSNADVVGIIKDTVKDPGMCSKRLATEAAQRGSKDNITVVVVFLRPVSTAERIY